MTTTIRNEKLELRTGCYSKRALDVLDFLIIYGSQYLDLRARYSRIECKEVKPFLADSLFAGLMASYKFKNCRSDSAIDILQDKDGEVVLLIDLKDLDELRHHHYPEILHSPDKLAAALGMPAFPKKCRTEELARYIVKALPKILRDIDFTFAESCCQHFYGWKSFLTGNRRARIYVTEKDIAAMADILEGKIDGKDAKKLIGTQRDMIQVAANDQIAKLKAQLKLDISAAKDAFESRKAAQARAYWKQVSADKAKLDAEIASLKQKFAAQKKELESI